jgi:hypothetical protein
LSGVECGDYAIFAKYYYVLKIYEKRGRNAAINITE